MTLAAGQLLLGRFRVETCGDLSAGAPVADGRDIETGAPVRVLVLDLLEPRLGSDPSVVLADQDRYRIGSDVLARPIAAGVDRASDGSECVVIAYERPSAAHLSDMAGAPVPAARVAEIVRGIARGIAPLHDQGIAFGQLRPDLVALGDSKLWLEGFSFEAVVSAVAGSHAALAALPPAYRAPEQRSAAPGRATPYGDTYALGVVVAELLSGQRLDGSESVVSPRALGVMVNDDVEGLIRRAAARSPVQRPDDLLGFAEELALALERPQASLSDPRPGAAAPVLGPEALERQDVHTPMSNAAAPPWAAPDAAQRTAPQAAPDAALRSAPRASPDPLPRPSPEGPHGGSAAPPSLRQRRTNWVAALTFIGGLLLMLLSVGGLFAYAQLRKAPPVISTGPGVGPFAMDAGAPDPADSGVVQGLDASGSGAGDPEDAAPIQPDDADGGAFVTPEVSTDDAGQGLPAPPSAEAKRPAVDDEAILPVSADVPVLGSDRALVTIVVFGDFVCPHTRRAVRVLTALARAFPSDLRVAWRHLPLSIHPAARDAARVAAGVRQTAGDAAFWRFVQSAAAGSSTATRSDLEAWTRKAGAAPASLSGWLSSPDTEAEVARDLLLAGLFDVRQTPTFFLNGARVEGFQELAELRGHVEKELSQARGLAAFGKSGDALYQARVRKNLIGLGVDVPERHCPTIGDSPMRGGKEALVTIVEFSEFQCPFCKKAQPTLESVLARFGGDVRLVWKNYPLAIHPHARPAANFALEAFEQGGQSKFWRVHDLLFADQKALDDAGLSRIAGLAGLDAERMLDATRRRAHEGKIDADLRLGEKLGVRGVPTFFVNGRPLVGAQPVERFSLVVQEEIDSARRLVSSGTPRSRVYDAVCGF